MTTADLSKPVWRVTFRDGTGRRVSCFVNGTDEESAHEEAKSQIGDDFVEYLSAIPIDPETGLRKS